MLKNNSKYVVFVYVAGGAPRVRSSGTQNPRWVNHGFATTGLHFIGILMLLLNCLCMVQCQDINRLNYGAYFDYEKSIYPVTSVWRHSVFSSLPGAELGTEFTYNTDFTNLTMGRHRKAKESWASCVEAAEKAHAHVSRPLTLCAKYWKQIRFLMKTARENHQQLLDLVATAKSLVPIDIQNSQSLRKRKGLLDFVGHAGKSLFGLATNDDLQILAKHVEALKSGEAESLNAIKTQAKHLASFSKITTDRVDQLVQNVQQSHVDQMKAVEELDASTTLQITYLANVTLHTMELERAFTLLARHYTNYIMALEVLQSGYLPAFLIPATTLTQILNTIEKELQQAHSVYRVLTREPLFYYQHIDFMYGTYNNQLIITLKIPLTLFQNAFKIFTIRTFPLRLPKSSEHLVEIEKIPAGIAIESSGERFYLLSENQIKSLHAPHSFNVEQRIFYYTEMNSCLMSLYLDNSTGVDQLCTYHIIMNSLETQVYHLYSQTFYFVNMLKFVTMCDNVTTVYTGCECCVFTLSGNCTFRSDTTFIPETLFENNQLMQLKHVTNKPLLHKFFDEAELQFLTGDYFTDAPLDITLPNFTFFTHNIDKKLAQDNKFRVQMSKAAAAVRRDEVIINSISEAVVIGDVDLEGTDFWLSVPGILFMVVTILMVLLSLHTVYLLMRIRRLSITVAVLKVAILKTEAAEMLQTPPLSLNYFTTPAVGNNTANTVQLQVVIMETTRNLWPYVIAVLLGLIVLTYLWYKIYSNTCKSFHTNIKITLYLQFIFGDETLFIEICQPVYGLFVDFKMEGIEFIRNIRVKGHLTPKLTFVWKHLYLVNNLTNDRILINEEHPLTWIQAKRLRKILRGHYACLLVLVQGTAIVRIEPAYIGAVEGTTTLQSIEFV